MSPMDEVSWFLPPVETVFSAPAQGAQLCKYDSSRIALIFSQGGNPPVVVTTLQPVVASRGLSLVQNSPVVMLTQKEHGPLCQAAWFCAQGGVGSGIVVFEVFLRAWPRQADSEDSDK